MAKELVHQHHKLVIMVVHDFNHGIKIFRLYCIAGKRFRNLSRSVLNQVLNSENIFNVYGVNVNILEGNYVATPFRKGFFIVFDKDYAL